MALLTVDWPTKVITIPQANLTLVSGSRYTYSVEQFFTDLLETFATEEAMVFEISYENSPPVNVGSIQLARVLQAINNYTWTFEDGEYSVELTAGNTNVFDVINKNNVNVFSANSAGLIQVELLVNNTELVRKLMDNRKELSDGTTGNLIVYDDDDVTPVRTYDVTDEDDNAIALNPGDPAKQSKGV